MLSPKMIGFDLVSEAAVSGIEAHFWRSTLTGQALLIAEAPTAAVNVAIVIPTQVSESTHTVRLTMAH